MLLKRGEISQLTAKLLIKTKVSQSTNFLAMILCSFNNLKIGTLIRNLVSNTESGQTPQIGHCSAYKSHRRVQDQAHAQPAQLASSARYDR